MVIRGVVVNVPFKLEGNSLLIKHNQIDPISLRQYVLYWDKIDWPENNLISFAEGKEIAYLKQNKVLQRTEVSFRGNGSVEQVFAIAQELVFSRLNANEPGAWTLAQDAPSLILPQSINKTRSCEVEFYRALPIPDQDVPLEKILEFKLKRQAELLALRTWMDDLYLYVSNASDSERAKVVALSRIELALIDLHKAMQEASLKRRLSNVKVSINPVGYVASAYAGAISAATSDNVLLGTLTAFLGIVGSSIIIEMEGTITSPGVIQENEGLRICSSG